MLSRRERVLIAVLVVSLSLLTVVSLSYIFYSYTIPSTGTIKAIGVQVFSGSDLTNPLESIDWGFVDPGSTHTRSAWVLNNGNFELTLSMIKSDWLPTETPTYITLTWDAEGKKLLAGNNVQVILTLTVSSAPTIIRAFSFTATIVGTATS
jgi:hypothetical protein